MHARDGLRLGSVSQSDSASAVIMHMAIQLVRNAPRWCFPQHMRPLCNIIVEYTCLETEMGSRSKPALTVHAYDILVWQQCVLPRNVNASTKQHHRTGEMSHKRKHAQTARRTVHVFVTAYVTLTQPTLDCVLATRPRRRHDLHGPPAEAVLGKWRCDHHYRGALRHGGKITCETQASA